MNRTSCPMCCNPCMQCCCPRHLPEKYPKVQYQSPEKGLHLFQPDSMEKSFVFHQPKAEYSIEPQTHDTIVSEQPRSFSDEMSLPNVSESGTVSMPVPITPDALPTLEFSLYYDIQKNTLAVHIRQAHNLPIGSKGVGGNTCVVVYLTPNKLEVFESQVIRKSANPEYDQTFHFSNLSGPELLRKQTLVFRVLEYTRFSSRDLVGLVTVPLADADLYGVSTRMEIHIIPEAGNNQDNSCGDMLVSLLYKPGQQSTIEGVVLRVANLHKAELTVTRDPYVKIHLYSKNVCQHKWKSSVKKQSASPIFNEEFHFDISEINLENITLEFTVMNHDRFSRDTVIGVVCVGSDVPEVVCRAHWEEVVGSPNHSVSRWLRLTSSPTFRSRSHTL